MARALALLYPQTSLCVHTLWDLGKRDELILLLFRVSEESLDTCSGERQLQIPCFVKLHLFYIRRRLFECAAYGRKLDKLILLLFQVSEETLALCRAALRQSSRRLSSVMRESLFMSLGE
jgi:hypothetical protein